MGTANFVGTLPSILQEYPQDKPSNQYWQQIGSVTTPNSSTATRIFNYFDIIPGASGAGFINTNTGQLYGIQSTQNSYCVFTCNYWNEASNWTTTVANFFHQFNWP